MKTLFQIDDAHFLSIATHSPSAWCSLPVEFFLTPHRFYSGGRRAQVLSLAQFRPEKNHALQLRAFAQVKRILRSPRQFGPHTQPLVLQLLARYDATAEPRPPRPRLVVAGAVRHEDDEALLAALRQTSHSLALQPDDVTFVTNLPIDAGALCSTIPRPSGSLRPRAGCSQSNSCSPLRLWDCTRCGMSTLASVSSR